MNRDSSPVSETTGSLSMVKCVPDDPGFNILLAQVFVPSIGSEVFSVFQ